MDTQTCANEACNEPTPSDMAAIYLDDIKLCSPACAREHLKSLDTYPETITLSDPQFEVSRSELPGVEDDETTITRLVLDEEDAILAIDEIQAMYPTEFRPTGDSRTNLKISRQTKLALDEIKQTSETWDDCLQRLVQLERATRIGS